jgi:uncharacterized protein (TIGR02598 family)
MFLHSCDSRLGVPGLLRPGRRTAFSLVEVVTAMAVFSFAMASMLTLLPAGMLNYQKAQNTTAFAQIVQNVTSDVELIGLTNLLAATSPNPPAPITNYFDDQGSPVTATDPLQVYTAIASFRFLGTNGSYASSDPTDPNSNPDYTMPLVPVAENTGLRMRVDVLKVSSKLLSSPNALKNAQTNTFSTIISY